MYGLAVGIAVKILHSENKGTDWEEQSSPANTDYRSVCICDHRTSWAVGVYGEIIHTDDGGRNWYELSNGTYEILTSVLFTDYNELENLLKIIRLLMIPLRYLKQEGRNPCRQTNLK
jgi:photosystem II stability/assembly factor-like uncharacterized protein